MFMRLVPLILLHAPLSDAQINDRRRSEANHITEAISNAVDQLPAGHAAKDDLRALRLKINNMLAVADATSPAEWDASLSALLAADYYGVDDLSKRLQEYSTPAEQAAESCEEDGSAQQQPTTASSEGRRLQQQQTEQPQRQPPPLKQQSPQQQPPPPPPPPSPSSTPPSPRPPLPPSKPPLKVDAVGELPPSVVPVFGRNIPGKTLGGGGPFTFSNGAFEYALDVRGMLRAFRSWAMDRPPPWERDCDCCFPACPQDHNCLLQSDGLYLACRGESLGEIVDRNYEARPLTMIISTVVFVVVVSAWLYQQGSILHAYLRPPPKEEEEEESDDDEEDDDDEEEDEADDDGGKK